MGSFSWLKADTLTHTANIVIDASFKFLIPKEFGGGFIRDYYQDYGYLDKKWTDNERINTRRVTPKYDMYELLAFWNADKQYKEGTVRDYLRFDGEFPPIMKQIDNYTDHNRIIGIDIGCYDVDMASLKYPLKLVSPSFKGTYEECVGISFSDPNQGFSRIDRRSKEYEEIVAKIKEATSKVSNTKCEISEAELEKSVHRSNELLDQVYSLIGDEDD